MKDVSSRFLLFWIVAGLVLQATSLFNDILEPDGALYAAISRHMVLTGDWVNLYGDGGDWLDKPHMPFWLGALSMQFLGITSFAYKLPAFICFLVGVWYLYRLTLALYNRNTALLSVLIYITALHTLLANFDVRAEAYLTAFVMAALFHLYKAVITNRWFHIPAAAVWTAMAVMTKGVFVLITIGSGLVIWWCVTRQWKQFIRIKWWLFLLLCLLLILPELICLYLQFDRHPEKMVFGRTGVSGLRFFFWDSQFGRFFNSGPIKGQGEPSFFLHTLLWAFLPWSVCLYVAIVQLFRKREKGVAQRWLIWGSAAVSFLMFSFSRFQLPHYIVILFPHAAMITAAYLTSAAGNDKGMKQWRIVQYFLFTILLGLMSVLIVTTGFISSMAWIPMVFIVVALLVGYRNHTLQHMLARFCLFSVLLFLFLDVFFYPPLLKYQAGMEAGKLLQQQSVFRQSVLYRCQSYSFEYYAPGLVKQTNDAEQLDSWCGEYGIITVLMPEEEWRMIREQGIHKASLIQSFPYFHISQLSGDFLNRNTRQKVLETLSLVVIQRQK